MASMRAVAAANRTLPSTSSGRKRGALGVTHVVSAVLLLSIRHEEAPPPKVEDREPVIAEIRHGLRLVRHDPVLRAFATASMLLAAMWGIFGAAFFLFAQGSVALGMVSDIGYLVQNAAGEQEY